MQVDPSEPVRIPLRNRAGEVVAYALVDEATPLSLVQARWYLGDGYAVRTVAIPGVAGRRTMSRLHREILGLKRGDGLQCDHINGNRLDNRRANLRVVTHAQNHQNVPSQHASSRYRGVSWDAAARKWRAVVHIAGRAHQLGRFGSEEEASAAASTFRQAQMPYTNEDRKITEAVRRIEVQP